MNRLDRIKVEGETHELVSEVKNLSLEYGFVTPYTSFFVEVPQAEEQKEEQTQEGQAQGEQAQGEQAQGEQAQSQAEQAMPMQASNAPAEQPPVAPNDKAATPGFEFWLAVPALCGALLILRRARH
jgi:hypothetical protein